MKLSIVIPVRRATKTLTECVASMRTACHGLDAEVIVAYATADETARLAVQLSGVRLVRAEGRRSVPQLRRDGVKAAQGEYVLITEDHCIARDDWARTLLTLFEGLVRR